MYDELYLGFWNPGMMCNPMLPESNRITGVGRAKGRGSDKTARYAAQKKRKRTKMKKASRRRNRR